MDPKFAALVETLAPKLKRLCSMPPLGAGKLPRDMPTSGVYLFSENARPMYVGRSNVLRKRYGRHCLPGATYKQAAESFYYTYSSRCDYADSVAFLHHLVILSLVLSKMFLALRDDLRVSDLVVEINAHGRTTGREYVSSRDVPPCAVRFADNTPRVGLTFDPSVDFPEARRVSKLTAPCD